AERLGGHMPVVMFETPHRLRAALSDLCLVAGPRRRLTIARELTKRFEEIDTVWLGDAPDWLEAGHHRGQGEFVLIVHAPEGSAKDAREAALSAEHERLMGALLKHMSV